VKSTIAEEIFIERTGLENRHHDSRDTTGLPVGRGDHEKSSQSVGKLGELTSVVDRLTSDGMQLYCSPKKLNPSCLLELLCASISYSIILIALDFI
jgi:hypothetical protein